MSNMSQLADRLLPHLLRKLEKLTLGGGITTVQQAESGGGGGDLTGGDGIDITGSTVAVDLGSPSGLAFVGGKLALSDTVAGSTLGISSKVLNVNTGHGFTWTGGHTFQLATAFNADANVAADVVFQGTNRALRTANNNHLWLIPHGTGRVMLPEFGTDIRTEGAISNFLGKGWQLNNDDVGWSHLDIRSIYAEELHVTAFIADTARVQVGETFVSNSMAMVADVENWEFVVPAVGSSAKLYVEDVPDIAGKVFDDSGSGDWVMLRFVERESGGLNIGTVWGQVTNYNAETTIDDVQSYTFTTRQAGSAGVFVGYTAKMGSLVIGFGRSGDSFIHTSVIADDAPWQRMMVWEGANPYDPANRTLLVQTGNLESVTHSGLNPTGHGFYGTNVFLEGALATTHALVDDNGLAITQPVAPSTRPQDAFKFIRQSNDTVHSGLYARIVGSTPNTHRVELLSGQTPTTSAGHHQIFIQSEVTGQNNAQTRMEARSTGTNEGASIVLEASTEISPVTEARFSARQFVFSHPTVASEMYTEHLLPDADDTYDLGSNSAYWANLYVKNIVADSVTGTESLGGQIWQYDTGDMRVRSNSNSTDRWLFVENTEAGFDMGLNVQGDIVVGGTVDGVDVSAFQSTFTGHVGNADAHHNAATGGDGIDVATGQVIAVDSTVVRSSRAVISGDGLQGGGNLSADRTLAVDSSVVRTSRQIASGSGLTGGGNLTTDRTLSVNQAFAFAWTAQHAFNRAVAGAPFTLNANAQGQTVTGLRADELNKTVAAGVGLAGGGLLTQDRSLEVVGADGIAVGGSGVAVDLATNSGLAFTSAQLHLHAGAGLARDANGAYVDLASNSGLSLVGDVLALGTPSLLTATSGNSVSTDTHAHEVQHSHNPGTNQRLLSSSADGVLILPRIGVNATPTGASLDVQAQVASHHAQRIRQIANQTGRLWRIEDTAENELIVLDSAGNLQSGQPGFTSGLTGWRISPQGNAEFNNGWFRGELHASTFVMDEFHATGGTLFVATAGTLRNSADSGAGRVDTLAIRTTSSAHGGSTLEYRSAVSLASATKEVRYNIFTLDINDPPSGAAILFPEGSIVRVKTWNGTGVFDIWARINAVDRIDGVFYRYYSEKVSGTNTTIPAGAAIVSYGENGDGRILLTSDLQNAPYIDIFTRGGEEPWTGNAGEILPHVRLGRLDGVGVSGVSGVEQYGLIAGSDLSDVDSPYLVASNLQLLMHRVDAEWNDGTNTTGRITAGGDVKFGTNIELAGETGFHFDPVSGDLQIGSSGYPGSVTIFGSIFLPTGEPAYINWRGNWAASTVYEPGDGVFHEGSSYLVRVAHTSTSTFDASKFDLLATEGAQGPEGPEGPQGPAGEDNQDFPFLETDEASMSGKAAGAYMTADAMGYWTGSEFRTYLDAGGNFFFGGSSGARLQYSNANNRLSGFDSGNNEQWYASGSDGKIYAGAGNVILDSSGIAVRASDAVFTDAQRSISFEDVSNGVASEIRGYFDAFGVDGFLTLHARGLTGSGRVFAGVYPPSSSTADNTLILSDTGLTTDKWILGTQFPTLTRRQGGHVSTWTTTGTTNYTPGKIRLQLGSISLTIPDGNNNAAVSVTFPTAFNNPPLVNANIVTSTSQSSIRDIIIGAPSSTSVTIRCYRGHTIGAESVNIYWVAHGDM